MSGAPTRFPCYAKSLVCFNMVRGKGVEPLTKRWQRLILPLN